MVARGIAHDEKEFFEDYDKIAQAKKDAKKENKNILENWKRPSPQNKSIQSIINNSNGLQIQNSQTNETDIDDTDIDAKDDEKDDEKETTEFDFSFSINDDEKDEKDSKKKVQKIDDPITPMSERVRFHDTFKLKESKCLVVLKDISIEQKKKNKGGTYIYYNKALGSVMNDGNEASLFTRYFKWIVEIHNFEEYLRSRDSVKRGYTLYGNEIIYPIVSLKNIGNNRYLTVNHEMVRKQQTGKKGFVLQLNVNCNEKDVRKSLWRVEPRWNPKTELMNYTFCTLRMIKPISLNNVNISNSIDQDYNPFGFYDNNETKSNSDVNNDSVTTSNNIVSKKKTFGTKKPELRENQILTFEVGSNDKEKGKGNEIIGACVRFLFQDENIPTFEEEDLQAKSPRSPLTRHRRRQSLGLKDLHYVISTRVNYRQSYKFDYETCVVLLKDETVSLLSSNKDRSKSLSHSKTKSKSKIKSQKNININSSGKGKGKSKDKNRKGRSKSKSKSGSKKKESGFIYYNHETNKVCNDGTEDSPFTNYFLWEIIIINWKQVKKYLKVISSPRKMQQMQSKKKNKKLKEIVPIFHIRNLGCESYLRCSNNVKVSKKISKKDGTKSVRDNGSKFNLWCHDKLMNDEFTFLWKIGREGGLYTMQMVNKKNHKGLKNQYLTFGQSILVEANGQAWKLPKKTRLRIFR